MEVDVAVLGGGPGGYTAAIRAAQLGATVACIEKEPELGGTCLRVGCIPTKAWVQTAHFLHQANDTFAKLGVSLSGTQLDFAAANEWKAGVVKQMTQGVAGLFKTNGVEWVKGYGRFNGPNTIVVDGGEDVTFRSAVIATGSYPIRPLIPGLESDLCVDSTGLLAQTEVPRRLVILGGGIIGSEFASIFNRFGSEVTIIEMLDTLIPQEDADAGKELAKAFTKRGIALQLGKQCTKVEQSGNALNVYFGDGGVDRVRPDARLGRPRAGRRRLRSRDHGRAVGHAARASPPMPRAARPCRTSTRSETAPATGSSPTRPSARARSLPRTRAATTPIVDNRAVPRPIYTDPEIAGVGLTEAEAREQYGDEVAVGTFPWVANARAVMQAETTGWVKSIHETKYGELLGLIMVGPHVTDMIEAGVVAIDAEATVETVADGMTAHPTLSEAIKEAGLAALGRAIHIPNRKRAPAVKVGQ